MISPADPCYAEVLEFLYAEAELLDGGQFSEWLELLTEDIRYRLPLTVTRKSGPGHSDESEIMRETLASLQLRVRRLTTGFAWSETPPSRTRHLITNVRVRPGERAEELNVTSNLLVYRGRGSETTADLFCGERQDLLRRVDGRLKLASRTILLDQAVLASRDVSIFF